MKSLKRETPEAVSISFEIPEDLNEQFQYREGQYLTLRTYRQGEEVRRSYSFSSSPLEAEPKITVKEVHQGKMSTFLNQELKPGDTLEVMPPAGRFHCDILPQEAKSYFLFGGGSGITPLISIAKTVLQTQPGSAVFLLYGNKRVESVIFHAELEELAQQYPSRFTLQHVWEQVPQPAPPEVTQGITDPFTIHSFLNRHRPQHLLKEYFVCGPTPMMQAVERILQEKYIPKKSIHLEYFGTGPEAGTSVEIPGKSAKLTAMLKGEPVSVQVPEGKTVLDALLNEGYDVPFSCRSGSCSTCLGRCTSGKVEMRTNLTLEDDEVAEGLVLTCQAVPTTEKVEITYDNI
ncbi:MAG: 2Fe-2S iron-sulfur cluster-binding protein [Bacteroidota bacterium]